MRRRHREDEFEDMRGRYDYKKLSDMYELYMTDCELVSWFTEIQSVYADELSDLFEAQLTAFGGRGRGYRESTSDVSICELLENTRQLQLELVDIATMRQKVAANRTLGSLNKAALVLRNRY